jgi:antirestriction protein ArdC
MKKTDIYQNITDRILGLLKEGTVPWHRPWAGGAGFLNLKSKKAYRGVNIFILASAGYSSPYWASYKQVSEMGGQVRKGEHGTKVIFWRWIEVEDKDTGKPKKIPFLRDYTVFNVEQCDGLESKIPTPPEKPPVGNCEAAEAIVDAMPKRPEIKHGGHRAFYAPKSDHVGMPDKQAFDGCEEYHSTLFHELVHSTGHESRVGRPGIEDFDGFGSHQYSKEELVAEMGAAFLCGLAGIESKTLDNSAAYIASWMKKIAEDPKLVVQAAAQAQRAVDFITDKKFENNN